MYLYSEILGSFYFLSPPYDEQQKLAIHIKEVNFKIDNQTNKINEVIQKLIEYRTALITAAVTGKIDIRNIKILEKPLII